MDLSALPGRGVSCLRAPGNASRRMLNVAATLQAARVAAAESTHEFSTRFVRFWLRFVSERLAKGAVGWEQHES